MTTFNQIDAFIHAHVYFCIGALWIFSNMVLQMPAPGPTSSGFYKWAFGVLHAIAGALPRVASNFLPAGSWIEKLLAGGNGTTSGTNQTKS